MFAVQARGRTVASLAQELSKRDVVCPSVRNAHRSGEWWIVRTVAMILENPRYTGRQVWPGPRDRLWIGWGSTCPRFRALRYNPVNEYEV
ncbi:recombinase family protein [Lentzea aerocolonigenes]|uniref:recombinase family protein n=1 Tax=Lentzea aerocolonigenes TaxID=68170 RepID=UPI00138E3499|nr:recombinase family protein [Lentzea aerocolonigenes]MCP2247360.1 Recombinase [Lentzea aerocolonigenes]